MRLETIKTEDIQKSCPLDGVKISETRKNSYSLTSITLTDAAGHTMVIEGGEYTGSIRVLVKSKPPKVKKYTVTGSAFTGSVGLEVAVNETFEGRADAVNRKLALEQAGGSGFKITETETEVTEDP